MTAFIRPNLNKPVMRTFSIDTLGCKVNQYESEQIASLLRARGLVQVHSSDADLRVINTCSVTIQAASKSRQSARRAVRLPVISSSARSGSIHPHERKTNHATRVIVTGCWATSDPADARALPGVDAVIGHHDDVAAELDRLLEQWNQNDLEPHREDRSASDTLEPPPKPVRDDVWMKQAGAPAVQLAHNNKPPAPRTVKRNLDFAGTRSLPLLDSRQASHQRAMLKIQDGCDAHCSYCIIPQLRPALWSKPIDDVVLEARRLVAAGHREIVLTGIFLGAFGQPTAIRKRQPHETGKPLAALVEALCTRVPRLRRLRFSSLEPGDLTDDLIKTIRAYPQCVPHFHLPLQSGSDAILRRMNRQYTRDEFLRMIDDVNAAFDRPAITTDIITGFPGETDAEFARTLAVVDRVRFIHIHAFHFSPRPGTAAARWTRDFIRGPIVNERINTLTQRAMGHSVAFRQQFLGEIVELLVERTSAPGSPLRHGRCERYFDVHFEDPSARPGDLVRVRVEHVTPTRTSGRLC